MLETERVREPQHPVAALQCAPVQVGQKLVACSPDDTTPVHRNFTSTRKSTAVAVGVYYLVHGKTVKFSGDN